MAINLASLYDAGTDHAGFWPDQARDQSPSAKRRDVFGESHDRRELRPAKIVQFEAYRLPFRWMTASNEYPHMFAWHFHFQSHVLLTASRVSHHLDTAECDHALWVELRVSASHSMICLDHHNSFFFIFLFFLSEYFFSASF